MQPTEKLSEVSPGMQLTVVIVMGVIVLIGMGMGLYMLLRHVLGKKKDE